MMKNVFWVICCILASFSLSAQSADNVPLSYTVHDDQTREIWDFWVAENEKKEGFRAWRILAAGVESRRSLDDEISRFKKNFPDQPYDWSYDPPLYKLKTGMFLERLDAKPLLYRIKEHFPSALEIRDRVTYEDYFEAKEE